jgi:stearoyl-CoA desaturase (delta-9 desaturase)
MTDQHSPAREMESPASPEVDRRQGAGGALAASASRDDVQPVSNEAVDRLLTAIVTIVPFVGLGLAAWQMWDGLLRLSDVIVFGIMYVITGLGVTVGFHRLFTHRSFKTYPAVRAILAVLGSAAIEGPVVSWVSDHRKHHAFSDREGDPHSPHVDQGSGLRGRCCRGSPTPTWAGSSYIRSGGRTTATRRT